MKHELITQTTLSSTTAVALCQHAMTHAESLGIAISICVVDISGLPLCAIRMNRSPLVSPAIAQKKAFTAVSFNKPTKDWQALQAERNNTLLALQSEEAFTFLGGGLPIIVNQTTVGAIGISGGSEAQDIECAEHAIQSLSIHSNNLL